MRLGDDPEGSSQTRSSRSTWSRATLVHVKNVEEKQNVTLALPKRLLKRVRLIAAERDTSISAILTTLLEGVADDDYERARRHAVTTMNKGFDLGTQGMRTWTRDELHER